MRLVCIVRMYRVVQWLPFIPPGFLLIHRPWTTGHGGGVGFFTRNEIPAKSVDLPTYHTFKNIVVIVVSHSKPFTVAFDYCTLAACFLCFL